MSVINNIYDKIVNYNWIHFNISINNRREVEVDMEKCKKRNTEHCTKSKFCAIRDRSKIIEPLLESYLQVLVTTSLNGFTSYLLAIV